MCVVCGVCVWCVTRGLLMSVSTGSGMDVYMGGRGWVFWEKVLKKNVITTMQ